MFLHVRSFTMRADHTQVRPGETFHLTVELRTDEAIPRCNVVTLPGLYGFDSLGEERRGSVRPEGTTCTAIVTLSPTEPGERTIPPATLDAIDAATNTPSRFSTNTTTIKVLHAPLGGAVILRNTVIQMLKAFVVIALAGALLAVGYWALRRVLPGFASVRRIEPPEDIAARTSGVPPDEREQLRAIVEVLAEQPTRQNVLTVRMIIRDMTHAREDEVFGELLARTAANLDPALLDVMRAIERAAFIDDEHLAEAVRDAVRALKQWTYKYRALA